MNSFVCLLFVSTLALSQASLIPLGLGATLVGPAQPGVVLKGPASQTTLVGPDGSAISAAAQAGAVAASGNPGGIVSAAVSPGVVGISGGLLAGPTAIVGAPLGLGVGLGGIGLGGVGLGGIGLGGVGLGLGNGLIAGKGLLL